MDNAAPVTVRAGETAGGLDIRLRRVGTFHVRGKIADVGGRYDVKQLIVDLLPRTENMLAFGLDGSVKKDLTFDLAGVPPGSYSLILFAQPSGFGPNLGRQTIDVVASDLDDVVVNIIPPGTLRGHALLEGGPEGSLASMRIFLNTAEGGTTVASALAGADGTFSVEKVASGKYYVHIGPIPQGVYLKSMRLGKQDITGQELDFQNGVAGELEIVLSSAAAEVSGIVKIRDSYPQPAGPPPNYSVVLAPDTLNADGSGLQIAKPDQYGVFSLKPLRPGHYRAYAFEQIEIGALNPDVLQQLESKGTEIELAENDKKQIQLTPIPDDDMRELFASLGIALEPQ
jgi:hypothetical protein